MAELKTAVVRVAPPSATPEEVLALVQAAFDRDLPRNYVEASVLARSIIRTTGWRTGNDWGFGRQYSTDMHSAAGQFILYAIMPDVP